MTGSAWITRAGQGSRATEEPAAMLIKIGSGLTEGHWALLEGRTAPGIDSGLHRHEDGVKAFYVLDGAYELFCDGSWSDLHAGDAASLPAGAVHGFRAGPGGGRALVIYPGDQERWFTEVIEAGGATAIGAAAVRRIAAAHGIAQLGPLPPR
jgi:quercetin dioxygenase-like cupin family protein